MACVTVLAKGKVGAIFIVDVAALYSEAQALSSSNVHQTSMSTGTGVPGANNTLPCRAYAIAAKVLSRPYPVRDVMLAASQAPGGPSHRARNR